MGRANGELEIVYPPVSVLAEPIAMARQLQPLRIQGSVAAVRGLTVLVDDLQHEARSHRHRACQRPHHRDQDTPQTTRLQCQLDHAPIVQDRFIFGGDRS